MFDDWTQGLFIFTEFLFIIPTYSRLSLPQQFVTDSGALPESQQGSST